jgi:hypothetical protein
MGPSCGYILSNAVKRFYYIRYLVRAGIRDTDVVEVYCSIIRSVLEYACPVWHPGLSKKLSNSIERVQKRVIKLKLKVKNEFITRAVVNSKLLNRRRGQMAIWRQHERYCSKTF